MNSWLGFVYFCCSAGCSGSHCGKSGFVAWKIRNGKTSLNYRFISLLSFSPTWGVRKLYHVLEKTRVLFFSMSVVTLMNSLSRCHWSKLTSVKGSWLRGHLIHEILKIKSTQRNKGYLETVDNSACKLPVCHLTNCFYVQLFESFGLNWKWNGFQNSLSLIILSSSQRCG